MNRIFHINAFRGMLIFLLMLTLNACAARPDEMDSAAQPVSTSTFEANTEVSTTALTLLPPLIKSAYLPAGFIAYMPEAGVYLFQEKGGQSTISLLVQETLKTTLPAELDGSKEIMIRDRPTLVIRGKYGENGKWDATQKNIQLYWEKDEWTYILASETVSEVELIKVAWSIE